MRQEVSFCLLKERTFRWVNPRRFDLKDRGSLTPEQDILQWLENIALWFLRWTGRLKETVSEDTTFERVILNVPDVVERIWAQNKELHHLGFRPTRLLIGPEELVELKHNLAIKDMISFEASICQDGQIFGLQIQVIPWMRGVLALP